MDNAKQDKFLNFNLKRFIKLCFKSWPIFVATVLACSFLMGVVSIIKPQKREVLAQMLLREDSGSSSMMMAGQIARSFSLGDMFGGSSSTDNEAYVIKSHTVFLETAKQLGLNTGYLVPRTAGLLWKGCQLDHPLQLIAPPEAADTITTTLLFRIKKHGDNKYNISTEANGDIIFKAEDQTLPATLNTPYGKFEIEPTEYFDPDLYSKYKITFCSYHTAASQYEKLVNVYVPDRKSDFINLSFVTDDTKFGKLLLNTIIDNYGELSNQYNYDRSSRSLKLVNDRLATLGAELHQSEHQLEQFKKDHKLTDVEIDAQYLMNKTGALENSLFEAQTNFEVVKLTRDFINNPENNYSLIPDLVMSTSPTLSSDNSSSLISQYNQLILERMKILSSAKPNNAIIKQLDQQIDALRGNIITSINRVYDNVALTLRDLKGEDTKNKSRIGELPSIERQYLVLKRDNLLQEQIYLFLLQQREELNMSLTSKSQPAQLIDPPYVLIERSGLSLKLLLCVGIFLGLCLGVLYVFLFKMPKHAISSASEVRSLLKTPVFHQIKQDDNGILPILSDGPNNEAFRLLRSDVQGALKQCDGKTVVVTSLNSSEGKTYVSINLAASLALTGKKVILIDTALRNPEVAKLLEVKEHSHILSDYVLFQKNDIKPSVIAVGDKYEMSVIASDAPENNPSDIIASDRFAELVNSLKVDYDYIIIDSSRIKDYSEIYYLTDITDITLIVTKANISNSLDIDIVNNLFEQQRLKRMAVIMNGYK